MQLEDLSKKNLKKLLLEKIIYGKISKKNIINLIDDYDYYSKNYKHDIADYKILTSIKDNPKKLSRFINNLLPLEERTRNVLDLIINKNDLDLLSKLVAKLRDYEKNYILEKSILTDNNTFINLMLNLGAKIDTCMLGFQNINDFKKLIIYKKNLESDSIILMYDAINNYNQDIIYYLLSSELALNYNIDNLNSFLKYAKKLDINIITEKNKESFIEKKKNIIKIFKKEKKKYTIIY